MRAAVLHEVNQPMTIETLEVAKPQAHEVLLRTAYAGLCHSDLHFMEGLYPMPKPCVLGHESSAVVEAVGSEVSYVKPGDRVITCTSVFCGTCYYCTTGRPQSLRQRRGEDAAGCGATAVLEGKPIVQCFNLSSFAEQLLVHENAVVKIADDIPLNIGCLVGCGVITGAGAVINTAKVPAGATVAVFGCGGIGLSAVNGAAIAGADRIIAVDTISSKLDVARHDGRHRRDQCQQCRPCRGDQGNDRRRRGILLRGGGSEEDRRAELPVHARRRHSDDHRHGAVRHED